MIKRLSLFFIVTLLLLCYTDRASSDCNISATPLSFGDYSVFTATPLDTTGTITVDCDHSPPPTVVITIGQSTHSGGFDPRAMKHINGTELINYNLYTDSSRSTIWGDGTGNTATVQQKVRKNKPYTATVYGRVPPIQDVVTGDYNETVTVTIIW